MKRYTVNIHYDTKIQILVEAENEEQVIQYAKDEAEVEYFDFILENGETCVVDIEDIPH